MDILQPPSIEEIFDKQIKELDNYFDKMEHELKNERIRLMNSLKIYQDEQRRLRKDGRTPLENLKKHLSE